ncbi:MAG: DciA family protein [Chloracidobacterium sp.]|uniref:DUF721 domain-containing protein n=1 Tax=Chloracidobacterium validum TaxID=2821543 RepID=A0ABX8B833_9BACT|nr:DciA family protein [Chloracidobacterium validum]QUW03063.1 DUF721 domain-containing protein [Chloracidobacterium validum]
MESIARLIPDVVKFADGQDDVLAAACGAAWALAVGDATLKASRVVSLTGRTLTVATHDARWKRQLEAIAPQILFQLNHILRQTLVTRIHLTVDEKFVALARYKPPSPPLPVAVLPEDLVSSASVITDESMRAQFLRLAAACLARDRQMESASRHPEPRKT